MLIYFDAETIALLRTILDHTWANLPPNQQAVTNQSILAERILRAAAQGERDPERLHALALGDCADLDLAG
jgi:hypothetical protein